MNLIIREAESGDEPALRECLIALQDYERTLEPRLRPGNEIADEYWRQLRAKCAEQGGTTFVGHADGEIAGYVTVLAHVPYEGLDDPPGEYAYVSDLYVHPRFRGRGCARALLTRAEQHARAHGAREIRIGALASNTPARELYRSFGFVLQLETLGKSL
jgi:ribosomal protein S18 acetylase RimI-like enzyme